MLIIRLVTLDYMTFTFSHLADTFIQTDLQMRTMEAIQIKKEQWYVSAITSLS